MTNLVSELIARLVELRKGPRRGAAYQQELGELMKELDAKARCGSISIEHQGRRIEGRITYRTRTDITVEIVQPYQNLETGLHIPYFCCPYVGFAGEYGEESAKELLLDLYEIGCFLEENFRTLNAEIERLNISDAEPLDDERWDRFFEENFPMTIPFSMRGQVVDILNVKIPLRAKSHATTRKF